MERMMVTFITLHQVPVYSEHTGEFLDVETVEQDVDDIEVADFHELLCLFDYTPHRSRSGPEDIDTWASGYDSDCRFAYETGGQIEYSLHFDRNNHKRYDKYWIKAMNMKTS